MEGRPGWLGWAAAAVVFGIMGGPLSSTHGEAEVSGIADALRAAIRILQMR
ncbi:hypothetical protein [Plastoroseomonas hellenica]|uniref:Uncharacterized protein n=1 Tax=Plastoroseomonas hellenica TaxID=2687306 RepID=A0ABS5F436_9PROT|nr:hypothetical protein [Plastoroseomonas hellenica]MBR0644993.1 hypothetical protein [Plastoroseomonas hellenica]MBR0667341.1 hypothetical protein [Plastoroseomonas hellenica]